MPIARPIRTFLSHLQAEHPQALYQVDARQFRIAKRFSCRSACFWQFRDRRGSQRT